MLSQPGQAKCITWASQANTEYVGPYGLPLTMLWACQLSRAS